MPFNFRLFSQMFRLFSQMFRLFFKMFRLFFKMFRLFSQMFRLAFAEPMSAQRRKVVRFLAIVWPLHAALGAVCLALDRMLPEHLCSLEEYGLSGEEIRMGCSSLFERFKWNENADDAFAHA